MPCKKYSILSLVILCLLLGSMEQIKAEIIPDRLILFQPFPYKDGLLLLKNTYIPEKKRDNNILTDEYRPHGIYTFSVYGRRTILLATPYTKELQLDTVQFPPFYEGNRQTILNPANLLTRIKKNGHTLQDWKPVLHSSPQVDSFLLYYPKKTRYELFVLADDSLQIDEVMVVDGRLNNDTTILFTYYIRRIARPIRPRLLAWTHEWQGTESRITPQMINRHLLGRNRIERSFESGELEGGDGKTFRNELFAPTSSFIFYFGKADVSFADSTMEYRILGGRYKDSSWLKTGHLIMMDGLTGDERYSLEVRYIGYPESTVVHTFVTKPYWYQRIWFRWLVGGILFTLILLLIIGSYRRKLAKEKAKKAGLADRLRTMQAQLNPHFIFNALNSIQALMSRQENDKAHQYLSTFGSLLRNVLTNSNQNSTTLDQEIRSLESYLQLEQLRFQFQFTISVAENIQTTVVSLPVMLLQPLVENAVRHGIDGMEEKGYIRLAFTREGANLLAIIEDNGKGFDTTQPSTGYGLKLVKEKIQLINTLHGQQAIHLAIQSTNAGTTVHLNFKNWLA